VKPACDPYAEDLSELIDGELPAKRRAEVEAHVAGCADCRARAAELRQLSAGISRLPKMPASSEFLKEVRGKIARGDQPCVENWRERTIRSPWVLVPVRVAAALAIVFGLVSLFAPLYNSRQNRIQQTQLAKVEKPARSAEVQPPESSAGAAATPVKQLATAPAAGAPVKEKLAGSQVDQVAKDEAKAPVGMLLADTKDKAGLETIIVESSDPGQVQAQANQMALALNGRVTTAPPQPVATRQLANSFYVELPARNAVSFRNQLMNQYAPASQLALSWSQAGNYQSQAQGGFANESSEFNRARNPAEKSQTPSNEPLSVLEIQVVPPAK
jgi:anti-sigma factor RsiW